MVDTFLTRDEIAVLTGVRSKSKQAQQLVFMRIPFELNALRQPIVLRKTVEERLGGLSDVYCDTAPRSINIDKLKAAE